MARFSHVLAFDDAPFDRAWRGDVPVVGVAASGPRVDGIVTGRLRRDGANATRALAALTTGSRFAPQTQLILLQGIALGGFNVVNLEALRTSTGCAVLVVARKRPNLKAIESALLDHVPGGARKWRLIQQAGPMEPCADLWVQRAGLTLTEASAAIEGLAINGRIPEPLRLAHLIAGALATGHSRGRA